MKFYIQSLGREHDGRHMRKRMYIYIYDWVTMDVIVRKADRSKACPHFRNWHSTVNQLYFNFKKLKRDMEER